MGTVGKSWYCYWTDQKSQYWNTAYQCKRRDGFGHSRLYKDVIEAITYDREPYVNGEAGKQALELVLAIYKSAAGGGERIKFPLKSASTIDFEGRFD